MVLDNSLIDKFRDEVNKNSFIFFKYHNYEEKDKWSCICSAMDWITVAIDFINSDWNQSNNVNIKCMNFYTYISSIDILWEAIQQLHRVFFNTKKIPFKDENKCFETKVSKEDDNVYFKTIRACFGAHPININLKEDKNSKRFASWPFEGKYSWSEKDFKVTLYSNQQETKDIYLGINISELNNFVSERYKYLLKLIKEIANQYQLFIIELKERKIIQYDEIPKQINQLKIESKQRLFDDYTNIIDNLECIFKVKSNSQSNKNVLEFYKENLLGLVKEVNNNLQEMKRCKLNKEYIISPDYPSKLQYSMEKLSNAMWGGTELYAFTGIQNYLIGIIDFDCVESLDERYALTHAGLYIKKYCCKSQ